MVTVSVAQTFYVDRTAVKNSDSVTITSVDVFFQTKPRATGNASGITNPGANLYILNTIGDAVPDASNPVMLAIARLEYNDIIVSSDATGKSTFTFSRPVVLSSGKNYALAFSFDGNEAFTLWTCKEGDLIVGTNQKTGGSTAKNIGSYYTINSSGVAAALSNQDIKFTVNIGLFSANSSADSIYETYVLPSDPQDLVLYDRYHYRTTGRSSASMGELVFLETPVLYGSINVSAACTHVKVVGNTVNFTNLLIASNSSVSSTVNATPSTPQKSYIVLRNGGTTNSNVNIREVIQVVSNTEIVLDRFPDFTNNTATFSVTAAGRITYNDIHWYDGRWWNGNTWNTYVGHKVDIIRITDTNANSTVRFSNNYLLQLTINSGGTGYSNNDTVTVYPVTNANTADANNIAFIPSYANAVAKVVTNGSGTITGLTYINAGYGLTAQTAVSITTSAGTSANIVPEIGSMIRCERSGSTFGNTVTTNIPVHLCYPHCEIGTNQNTTYSLRQHYPYYVNPGYEHILKTSLPAMVKTVDAYTPQTMADLQNNDGRLYVIASRSYEVMQTNAVIQVANGNIVNTSVKSSSILEVSITSNNAYTIPLVTSDDVYNYHYIINNDATGENKNYGKALCRQLSNKITLNTGQFAEDLIVYVQAYRPINTNVKIYAKFYNTSDSDAFEDKDWTELTLTSNNANTYSSITNTNDLVEYIYALGGKNVKTVNTITGSATTTLNSNTIVGIGTSWNTDINVNDVIKIYPPLFPQNWMVSTVVAVSSANNITISDAVSNSSIVGSGLKIDLVGRPAAGANNEIGMPFQAFSNILNENVVRYYNSSMAKFDAYNVVQIKTVLLSNTSVVPQIESIEAVATTV